MKRTLLFFLLFTCIQALDAGNFLKAAKDTSSDIYASGDIYYGYKTYFHDFQHRFNTVYRAQAANPVQLVGIGYSGYFLVQRSSNFYGHFGYSQVLPQRLKVNDTISAKITGFVFSAAYGGAFVSDNKKFMLIVYLGLIPGGCAFTAMSRCGRRTRSSRPR